MLHPLGLPSRCGEGQMVHAHFVNYRRRLELRRQNRHLPLAVRDHGGVSIALDVEYMHYTTADTAVEQAAAGEACEMHPLGCGMVVMLGIIHHACTQCMLVHGCMPCDGQHTASSKHGQQRKFATTPVPACSCWETYRSGVTLIHKQGTAAHMCLQLCTHIHHKCRHASVFLCLWCGFLRLVTHSCAARPAHTPKSHRLTFRPNFSPHASAAWVAVVDEDGATLLKTFMRPAQLGSICWVGGVRPDEVQAAPPAHEVAHAIMQLAQEGGGRLVVGHGIAKVGA